MLHTGPALQTSLVTVFLHWRLFRIAVGADVKKMYRQINVDLRDVDLQRILWTDPARGTERHYQLMTVTYGMSCAPYLALRVLKQLAEDEGRKYPRAAAVLRRSMYVDDILTGADDIFSARQVRDELINLLKAGGSHCVNGSRIILKLQVT